MTPITADMLDETPMMERGCAELPPSKGELVTDSEASSPASVAQAIAERELMAIVESMLFVSSEPLSLTRFVAVLGDVTKDEVERVLGRLAEELEQEGRGVRLAEIAGGYRLVTKQEYSTWIKRLDKTKSTAKLSRSALESLAIIAYKQPIVRSEIEEIRGVETSGVVRTLLERKLVRIVGRKEVPGRPIMYGTTKYFLEHFGLSDLSQLPPLREFKELGEAEQSMLPMEETASMAVENEAVREEPDRIELDLAQDGAQTAIGDPTERAKPERAGSGIVPEGFGSAEVSPRAASIAEEELLERIVEHVEEDEPVRFSAKADYRSNEVELDEKEKLADNVIRESIEHV